MAFINDPEVTTFSETYARLCATILRDLNKFAEETVTEYFLAISGNAAFVAAAGGDFIGDQNGTTQPYTKDDLTTFITRLQQINDGAAGFEAGGGLNGANMMHAPLALVVRSYKGSTD